jgi:hypothetical protein
MGQGQQSGVTAFTPGVGLLNSEVGSFMDDVSPLEQAQMDADDQLPEVGYLKPRTLV